MGGGGGGGPWAGRGRCVGSVTAPLRPRPRPPSGLPPPGVPAPTPARPPTRDEGREAALGGVQRRDLPDQVGVAVAGGQLVQTHHALRRSPTLRPALSDRYHGA